MYQLHPEVLDRLQQAQEAASEARYQGFISTTDGMDTLIEGLYDEMGESELNTLMFWADVPYSCDDGYNPDVCIALMHADVGQFTAGQRKLWFAIDEIGGRLAAGGKVKRREVRIIRAA